MKIQYKKLKAKLIVMVLLVAILGSVSLVLYKATEIQDDYISKMFGENCDKIERAYIDTMAIEDERNDRRAQAYFYKELGYAGGNQQIGFYAVLTDLDNNIIANTQNMLMVGNKNDDTKKYILLGDYVEENSIKQDLLQHIHSFAKVHIKGYEDDYFIYPEEISFECVAHDSIHTLTLPKVDNMAADAKVIDYDLDGGYIGTNNSFCYKSIVNDEAKELIDDVMNMQKDDDNIEYENHNIFKTTIMIKDNHHNGMGFYNAYGVAVIHPVEMAIKELFLGIIAIVLATGILIIIIELWINKTIKVQEVYEKMRNEFTSGVAHEFKTPLALIKSYTENWEYIDDEDKPLYSMKINDEVDKLSDLVTEFLELSRLEANKKTLNLETVDLISLSQTVINSLSQIADESNLVINFNHTEAEVLIEADLEMMRTVIQNFTTNAIKHAKKEITFEVKSSNKGTRLSISNDGEMIDKEQIRKIWDIFNRGEDEKHSRLGSTGVGLSIAKNILMLHKFEYGCNSIEGQTTFWFYTRR